MDVSAKILPPPDAFRALSGIATPHLQTFGGHFYAPPLGFGDNKKLVIATTDNDHIEAYEDRPSFGIDPRGTAVLLHGISGSARSNYLMTLSPKLTRSGFIVLRINHRGAGKSASKGIYHAGSAADVATVTSYMINRYCGLPCWVVGFSLSGAMLLNAVADLPEMSAAAGAIAVCAPLDLSQSAAHLLKPANAVIHRFFVRRLIRRVKRQYNADLRAHMSIVEFDHEFTAPRAGFRSGAHYYEQCSPRPKLHRSQCPVFILAAQDDPIIPWTAFDPSEIPANLTVSSPQGGGHMGFLSQNKTPFGDRRWMDWQIMSWILSR